MKDKLLANKRWKMGFLATLALSSAPLSAFNDSEDASGDLADLATTPNVFVLDARRNTLSADVIDADDDCFTQRIFNRPLSGNVSFLGYHSGTTPNQSNP